MNHVPDEVLEALDRFGRAVLEGRPGSVREPLRSDIRIVIDWDAAALAAGQVTLRVAVDHPNPADSLGAYGPFVGTRLDGVERRLRAWGIDTPADYGRVGRGTDGWTHYEGDLRLPLH